MELSVDAVAVAAAADIYGFPKLSEAMELSPQLYTSAAIQVNLWPLQVDFTSHYPKFPELG